jgi:hypothetical protein
LQQQASNDDESGDEYDGSDDEVRNHLEPLLCIYRHEDNQPHNQQQEEYTVNREVNNFGNRNNNPVQQNKAINDDESGDEYDDSNDEIRNHSEPLLSYHEQDNQPHNQYNHRHVGETQNAGMLNNTVGDFGATLESLPPLPDTMQLVHILQEIQRATWSEQQDQQEQELHHHSEPLLS